MYGYTLSPPDIFIRFIAAFVNFKRLFVFESFHTFNFGFRYLFWPFIYLILNIYSLFLLFVLNSFFYIFHSFFTFLFYISKVFIYFYYRYLKNIIFFELINIRRFIKPRIYVFFLSFLIIFYRIFSSLLNFIYFLYIYVSTYLSYFFISFFLIFSNFIYFTYFFFVYLIRVFTYIIFNFYIYFFYLFLFFCYVFFFNIQDIWHFIVLIFNNFLGEWLFWIDQHLFFTPCDSAGLRIVHLGLEYNPYWMVMNTMTVRMRPVSLKYLQQIFSERQIELLIAEKVLVPIGTDMFRWDMHKIFLGEFYKGYAGKSVSCHIFSSYYIDIFIHNVFWLIQPNIKHILIDGFIFLGFEGGL